MLLWKFPLLCFNFLRLNLVLCVELSTPELCAFELSAFEVYASVRSAFELSAF